MSDDFIPFAQSTPTGGGGRWQNQRRNNHRGHQQQRYHQNQPGQQNSSYQNSPRQNNYNNQNRWSNSYRNSSYGSDNNSSFGQEKSGIDAYLHPSMLQDPWEELRRRMEHSKSL